MENKPSVQTPNRIAARMPPKKFQIKTVDQSEDPLYPPTSSLPKSVDDCRLYNTEPSSGTPDRNPCHSEPPNKSDVEDPNSNIQELEREEPAGSDAITDTSFTTKHNTDFNNSAVQILFRPENGYRKSTAQNELRVNVSVPEPGTPPRSHQSSISSDSNGGSDETQPAVHFDMTSRPIPDRLSQPHSRFQSLRDENDEVFIEMPKSHRRSVDDNATIASISHLETQMSINKLLSERYKTGNSLASVGRLFASRQKELDAMQVPMQVVGNQPAKKKKTCELKLIHVSLILAMIIIIATTAVTLTLYKSTKEKEAADLGFYFNYLTREFGVYPYKDSSDKLSSAGQLKFKSFLGMNLGGGSPYNCSGKYHTRSLVTTPLINSSLRMTTNEMACYKWHASIQLNINLVEMGTTNMCIDVLWKTERYEPLLEDCVDINSQYGEWFGGFINPASFNLGNANIKRSAYQPGKQFGPLAERFWVSTKGIAVIAPNDIPLQVSIRDLEVSDEHGNEKQTHKALCLSSWYGYSRGVRELKYSVCRGPQHQDIFAQVMERFFPRSNSVERRQLLTKFQNSILYVPQASNHTTSDIYSLNFEDSSTTTVADIEIYSRRVGSTLTPYVVADEPSFMNSLNGSYWMKSTDLQAPRLYSHRGLIQAMLNSSNVEVKEVLTTKSKLKPDEDLVFVDEVFPADLLNPDAYPVEEISNTFQSYIPNLINLVSNRSRAVLTTSAEDLIQTTVAFVLPQPSSLSVFVQSIIQASLSGYKIIASPEIMAESPEEFIRFAQIAIFLPIMRLNHESYMNQSNTTKARLSMLMKIRSHYQLPTKLTEFIIDHPLMPIYRPMWWIQPGSSSLSVSNQFIFSDYLVAPVVDVTASTRQVYFPPGDWLKINMNTVKQPGFVDRTLIHGPITKAFNVDEDTILIFSSV